MSWYRAGALAVLMVLSSAPLLAQDGGDELEELSQQAANPIALMSFPFQNNTDFGLGGGYVSSAVDDENRTPDLPVDQQVRGSTGIEYRISGSWTVGANYTFAWLGQNKIDQTRPLPGRIVGDYDAYLHAIGLYGSVWF